jgi:hypothetical protein
MAALCWAAMASSPWASAQTWGDITFFVGSDLHYGYTNGTILSSEVSRDTLASMNALPGEAYPAAADGGTVDNPRGVLLIGDLTESGTATEWATFTNDWGLNGEQSLPWPVYEGFGNHDCYFNEVVPPGIKARNLLRRGVSNISTNGYHYSWDWDYLHLVCLNLFPGETPDASGVSPRDSLNFLADDLAKNVGNSGRPVILYHHYGFDSFGLGWWSDQQRSNYLAVIQSYNVIAILTGHNHLVDSIPWGGFSTFNDGTVGKVLGPSYVISYLVVHVTQTNLTVVERLLDGTWGWGSKFNVPITVSYQPRIVSNPVSTNTVEGSAATLAVQAVGPSLNYQWFLNSTNPVAGATNSVLSLPNVLFSQSGTYSVLVTNAFGAAISQPAALTVSAPPPVVTLIGANPLTNECHAAFTDPGATASDTSADSLGVTANSTVNPDAVGTYTINYSATDPSGNSATNTRTVYIVDTTPPVVALIGDNPLTNAVHTAFTDPGATAGDACAGSLSVTPVNTVNPSAVGTYTNSYTATDPSGNSATITRTVYIVPGENVAGCVEITDSFTILVTNADANCEALMPDVTGTNYIQATDSCSDSLTITQDPTNNAPLSLGANVVVIIVTDGSNNVAYSTNTIIVTDVTPPFVTLIGPNPLTNECHAAFTDPGATAGDACTGSLIVATNSTVNTNTAGTYTIQYSATDPSGNSATNTRTVYIVEPPPPVVSVPSISLAGGNIILTYPLWASDYTLESATDFAPGSWAAVSAASVTNADNVVVTVPITTNSLYFRMRP